MGTRYFSISVIILLNLVALVARAQNDALWCAWFLAREQESIEARRQGPSNVPSDPSIVKVADPLLTTSERAFPRGGENVFEMRQRNKLARIDHDQFLSSVQKDGRFEEVGKKPNGHILEAPVQMTIEETTLLNHKIVVGFDYNTMEEENPYFDRKFAGEVVDTSYDSSTHVYRLRIKPFLGPGARTSDFLTIENATELFRLR